MVTEIENKIILKENLMKSIREFRYEIANLKDRKATKRNKSWADANGTAKEKEDYVKAQVSDIDSEILKYEADIELCYNQISILNDKIEMEYLSDE